MSEEKEKVSSYEDISVMIDGVMFGRSKENLPEDGSVRSKPVNPSYFVSLEYDIKNTERLSVEAKSLLLKRIQLYKGISQPLFLPAILQ